jgi:hypothetical protein
MLAQLLPPVALAQPRPSRTPFYGTYQYTAYTVYEHTSTEPPTKVSGVGGSLVLRRDGIYEKRMSIATPNRPYYFNQTGRFFLAGDSIRFVFTDAKGTDVQRGTFRFNAAQKRLTISILGYPTGSKGVYELVVAGTKPTAKPTARRPQSRKKARP